jgi:hypothetical protein
MLGKSLISALIVVSSMIGFGCSKRTFESDVNSTSGSGVNNGPGPVGDILKCEGKSETGEAFHFVIRHTAAVNVIQGLLQIGKNTIDAANAISTQCNEVKDSKNTGPDQPTPLWTCLEPREREGRWSVDVSRQGLSAVTLADVFIEQMFPLPKKKMVSLALQGI